MAELKFEIVTVTEKVVTEVKKGSKYDPIIDGFIERGVPLVEIVIRDMKPDYLRTQLQKRLKRRNLNDKYKSVGSSEHVYLEVIEPVTE